SSDVCPSDLAHLLPRGDRLAAALDRHRAADEAGGATQEERLRTVPCRVALARTTQSMNVIETPLPGCLIVEPKVFGDARGFFMENWNHARYAASGIGPDFVQSNLSRSARGVLRGLHYQWPNPQGKLVSVLEGEVYDVAVDIRLGSPTFGQWTGVVLSAE